VRVLARVGGRVTLAVTASFAVLLAGAILLADSASDERGRGRRHGGRHTIDIGPEGLILLFVTPSEPRPHPAE
jgi:hypothetical protein